MNIKYLVEQPGLANNDPRIMRGCKCIIQNIFSDKIVTTNSTSIIRMEDSGIHISRSVKNLDFIEIKFNIVEEESTTLENTKQYFKKA